MTSSSDADEPATSRNPDEAMANLDGVSFKPIGLSDCAPMNARCPHHAGTGIIAARHMNNGELAGWHSRWGRK